MQEKARLRAEAEAAVAKAVADEEQARLEAKAAAEAAAVAAPSLPPKAQEKWWKPSEAESTLAEAVALFEEATGVVIGAVTSSTPSSKVAPYRPPLSEFSGESGLSDVPVAVVAGAVEMFESSTGLVVDTIACEPSKVLPSKRSVSISVGVM